MNRNDQKMPLFLTLLKESLSCSWLSYFYLAIVSKLQEHVCFGCRSVLLHFWERVIPDSHFDSDPKSLLFLTFGNESVVVETFSATMKWDTCSRVCRVGAGLQFYMGWKTTCK